LAPPLQRIGATNGTLTMVPLISAMRMGQAIG
jgi:hypothetical protein